MDDNEERLSLKESLAHLVRNAEDLEASHVELSKLLYCRYKSLLSAGFNDKQAMAIILQRGINP